MIGYITEYQIQFYVVTHGTICDDGIYVRQEIFYNIHPSVSHRKKLMMVVGGGFEIPSFKL